MMRRTRRFFETAAEYVAWSSRVGRSRKVVPESMMETRDGQQLAPFLCGVNPFAEHRLRFRGVKDASPGTASASLVETTWPISTDEAVARDVADLQGWSSFRLAKFYSALDALTADAAYLHTDGHARGLALVTAGHYFSRKMARTAPDTDVTVRCYPTSTGSSSLEIRTDAVQMKDGQEELLNVCHTTMVCVDAATLRPAKGAVPELQGDPDETHYDERKALAALHADVRRRRAHESISLYARKLSVPPTPDEMAVVHALHREAVAGSHPTVAQHTHHASLVVFPEGRNVHGKTFGGFVASQAFDLAYYAAQYYVKGPFASLGLDEAIFLQPVSIGDMVNFHARVVHARGGVFRVSVNVDVVDPSDVTQRPLRTNFLRFVFAAHPEAVHPVLPVSYAEILGYVNAQRRHALEPISDDTKAELAAFFSADFSDDD